MLKSIFFGLLKFAGGLIAIILIIIGFMIYRTYGESGYRVGLFGISYFYKQSYASWFHTKVNLKGEHIRSFEVFEENESYAKDKWRVYYRGKSLPESDPETFSANVLFSEPQSLQKRSLCRDKNNIYYKYDLVSKDADNFQFLEENIFRDRKFVYALQEVPKPKYSGEDYFVKINGANPKTFQKVPEIHALYRDDQHVFYRNHLVDGAKIENLRSIKGFWTDGHKVFFHEHELKGAKRLSFAPLEYPYSGDGTKLFYKNLLMGNAKPNELKLMKGHFGYATIGQSVFFNGKQLPNVDLNSFELIEYRHWKDKSNVFYKNEVLPDADPKTFKLLKNTRGRNSNFGKDANSVFYKHEKLEGVNPATFGKKGKDRWRNDRWTDGNHHFNHSGERL